MTAHIDPKERLSEGWEPGPIPARTPDEPMPPPPRLPVLGVPAPTLCEAGPCVHYHCFTTRLDAAKPTDGSAALEHTQIVRSCYPVAGISVGLDETPVFECSLWAPSRQSAAELHEMRRAYSLTDDAKRYERELDAYRSDQERIAREAESFTEAPELGVLAAMIAEMQPGDALELRRKGKPALIGHLQHGAGTLGVADVGVADDSFMSFTDEFIAKHLGDGDYQVRCVNKAGAIVSTRTLTIQPLQENT